MKTKYQLFLLTITTPIINGTPSESPLECFGIHVQYKYLGEQVQEIVDVPRAATENDNLVFSACCYFSDSIDVPSMVLMARTSGSFSRFRVALTSKLVVAIDGSITTLSQFTTY